MEEGYVAVNLQRLLQPRLGRWQVAAAVMRGTEQIKRIGIARLKAQRFLGAAKRFARATGAKQFMALENQLKGRTGPEVVSAVHNAFFIFECCMRCGHCTAF
jgi:hypothetical protein